MGRDRRCASLPTLTITALCCAVIISGCARVVDGRPVGAPVPNANLDVQGDSGDEFDTQVKNALSDVMAFWKQAYPEIADGRSLPALKGKLYSVDGLSVVQSHTLASTAQGNACLRRDKLFIVDNAAYCEFDDSILWDRSPNHLLPLLANKYGSALTALVFAHEFGHAIQKRIGLPQGTPTIDIESQADCASGAFVAAAMKGQAPHFHLTSEQVDSALRGFLQVRDSTPESPEDISHGNGFDRLSALKDGIAKGVTYCFGDSYFADRQFTERTASDADLENGGNEPLSKVLPGDLVPDLNRFWTQAGTTVNHTFAPVQVDEVGTPPCATSDLTELAYCPDTNTVYYTGTFARRAYFSLSALDVNQRNGDVRIVDNQPADFALGTMVAIGWGMAARQQFFDESIDDGAGLSAAICYAGAYAANINPPTDPNAKISLSAADLDEASSAVLNLVPLDSAFGARETTGLQRVASFVTGYDKGLHSC